MRGSWLLLVALLLSPLVPAQPEGTVRLGSKVSVLVYHPNDGVDELGFPFRGEADAFLVRHGSEPVFADTVAFPGFVADGMFHYEGLAEADDTYDETAATVALYDEAVRFRLERETPISLRVATTGGGTHWNASVAVGTDTVLDADLRLWSAVVEDPVDFEPPILSNGVKVHPFTVRSVQEHGPVAPVPGVPVVREVPLVLGDWDAERILVVAWVEQGGEDSPRFDAGEVLQATNHPLLERNATVQTSRGVLVEAYSATWCNPCLVGDKAVEEVAARHGLESRRVVDEAAFLYYRPPAWGVFLAAIAAGTALALVRLPGGRR